MRLRIHHTLAALLVLAGVAEAQELQPFTGWLFHCDTESAAAAAAPPPGPPGSSARSSPYFADASHFLPPPSLPDLQVRANFIFLQRDDGTGGFQLGDPVHQQYLDDVVANLNARFANLLPPGGGCGAAGILPSARLQFVVDRYYIADTGAWDNQGIVPGCPGSANWYLNALDAAVVADPTIEPGINVYFTEDAVALDQVCTSPSFCVCYSGVHCSQFPSYTDLNRSSRVHMPNVFAKFKDLKNCADSGDPACGGNPWSTVYGWAVGELGGGLAHELGHSLALGHVYSCNNIMDPNASPRVFLDAGQVAIAHRALATSNLQQFIVGCPVANEPLVLDTGGTVLWDFSMRLFRDLVIAPGTTLESTCEIRFPIGSQADVMNGAELVVDGARLTNACDGMWGEIRVWGDPTVQHSGNLDRHGVARVRNGARVEGSRTAFSLTRKHPDGSFDLGLSGGVLVVSDAVFANNRRAIELTPFPFRNLSSVTRSTFETTEPLLDAGTLPGDQITLWDVDDVRVFASTFRNVTAAPEGERGNGIVSAGSNLSVRSVCQSPWAPCPAASVTRSRFEGLDRGVWSSGGRATLHAADFVGNREGVVLDGTDGSSVRACAFDVPLTSIAAVRIDESTRWVVQDCAFRSPAVGGVNQGVVVNNDGSVAWSGLLLRNSFQRLWIASGFLGNNTQVSIDCNTYADNTYDWSVAGAFGNKGSALAPLSNVFEQDCIGHFDIFSTASFTYYARPTATYLPACTSQEVTVVLGLDGPGCEATSGGFDVGHQVTVGQGAVGGWSPAQ